MTTLPTVVSEGWVLCCLHWIIEGVLFVLTRYTDQTASLSHVQVWALLTGQYVLSRTRPKAQGGHEGAIEKEQMQFRGD